jgi:hypothetical protein
MMGLGFIYRMSSRSCLSRYIMQVQLLIILFPEAVLYAFFSVAFAANGSSTYTYQHQGSQAFALALGLNTTSNDLHFNMSAPSTYSWFAFGIGNQMKNSLMFIGYPSSNGSGNKYPLPIRS